MSWSLTLALEGYCLGLGHKTQRLGLGLVLTVSIQSLIRIALKQRNTSVLQAFVPIPN